MVLRKPRLRQAEKRCASCNATPYSLNCALDSVIYFRIIKKEIMGAEIFKFSAIRPLQNVSLNSTLEHTIELPIENNEFLSSLVKARKKNSRLEIQTLVNNYTNSIEFINSRKKLDVRISAFLVFLSTNLNNNITTEIIKGEFERIFQTPVSTFVNSEEFKNLKVKAANSLICSMVASISPDKKTFIHYLVYTLDIIEQLSNNLSIDSKNIFKNKILIPEGIFPLPLINPSLKSEREKQAKAKEKLLKASIDRKIALIKQLEIINTALEESKIALQKPVKNIAVSNTDTRRSIAVSAKGFVLEPSLFNSLSTQTKDTLKTVGVEAGNADIAKAIVLLESQTAKIATELYRNVSKGTKIVKFGNAQIPDSNAGNTWVGIPGEIPGTSSYFVGPCPPQSFDTNINVDTGPAVPIGHGEARVLGVSDLMLIEQKLLRYELGEIAHIENVLKSEVRERKLKTSKTTEQSTFTETEDTDEKQKDLTTTDRYELQNEIQKVISEDTSKEAGVTVTASYGPSVDVTANANYTANSSIQDSQLASSNFARETTSRAVSRLEKRKLERRFTKTVENIVEVNRHSFENNKQDSENISGIYRWVDKIYEAQIVNYGMRLMLEFIVPEPAAFLRYSMSKVPTEDITVVKPDEPGFCVNNSFISLNVGDISRDTYMMWVSKYDVEDVVPPPLSNLILSKAITSAKQESERVGSDIIDNTSFSIDIPEGYYPLKATIKHDEVPLDGSPDVRPIINILIDDKRITGDDPPDTSSYNVSTGNWKNIAVAVNVVNKALYAVVVNVFCLLTKEKYEEWQIQTYNAIMNAYQRLKSNYDNAIAAAKIRAGYTQIQGTNPLENRESEKVELKRACISLLTGQRFDLFNSMNSNVGRLGFPEIDFDEAKQEGPYIQFFENAIEWNNISYIFYPYFWGNKNQWLSVSNINDPDPLYTSFLKAGAARVQVPVRPGRFNDAIMYYLTTGQIWNGEGRIVNIIDDTPDPLYVSVIEELKNQLGNNNIEGDGTITVTKNNDMVTGTNTNFSNDVLTGDENKRIIIAGETYVIKKVNSLTEIQLKTSYKGESNTDLKYAFGAKLVGDPWEVKLPTDLVMIDNNYYEKIIKD